jgi:hypothetical protein
MERQNIDYRTKSNRYLHYGRAAAASALPQGNAVVSVSAGFVAWVAKGGNA